MPNYRYPGVFIEEVSTGAGALERVGTSTPGFLGQAPDPDAHRGEAIPIPNWEAFRREFWKKGNNTPLAQGVWGFFLNGGGRCYVANTPDGSPLSSGGGVRDGLQLFEAIDEIAMLVAPGRYDMASHEALISQAERLGDRFAILDSPPPAELGIDRVAALTTVATTPPDGKGDAHVPGPRAFRPRQTDRGYAAFYYPPIWVGNVDPTKDAVGMTKNGQGAILSPPSGYIAGVYARTDTLFGVHRAPANMHIDGATGVSDLVTYAEQAEYNSSGVNIIRSFPGEGVRIWGARTLASGASEWRYINVRRLFNMVEQTIARGLRFAVFESNDADLWMQIRRAVSGFLHGLWREHALVGATPEAAYFVKCDAETNPPDVVDSGTVITKIGICPVKPAEFVVFQIGQRAGGAVVKEGSDGAGTSK